MKIIVLVNLFAKLYFLNFTLINFNTACTTLPELVNGTYIEGISENYIKGATVNFACDDETYRIVPSNGQIVCGDSGWVENPTCSKSWSILLLLFFLV